MNSDYSDTPNIVSPALAFQKAGGFPKSQTTRKSLWLQTVQGDSLLSHRTSPDLPSTADIVVIGSGITGTLVAKHCIETWPEKKIVVLEAREFCSGATGRNAGHCKPDQWRGFVKYQQAFGNEQALKILENEQQTWSSLVKYVRDNNVDCDLWVGDTFDVPVTTEVADELKQHFESFKAAGGKADHIKVTHDPQEAATISRIKEAEACYAWPASTLHPWKLTAHVMRENLKKGVNLQTRTRVKQVIRSSKNPNKWVVRSERGDVECDQVVHATNAFSSALEPSLRGLIRPQPHICDKFTPSKDFLASGGLQNSYGIILPDGALITINPRNKMDQRPLLFGGSNPGQLKFEQWLQENPENCINDDLQGFGTITKAAKNFAQSQITGWRKSSESQAEPEIYSWSGIIAMSLDAVPFVGQLPGLPGQWVCAGHHGHGMARIFTAAPGLVKLMSGSSWTETQLPDVFQITPSRVQRLKEQLDANRPIRSRI